MSGVYDGLIVVELADRKNQWAGKLLAENDFRFPARWEPRRAHGHL